MAEFSKKELEIDAATLLPLRLRSSVRHRLNPQWQIPVEYAYEDYRQEGPFLLPHVVREIVDGKPQSIITFDSFEIGAALSADEFEVR